MKINNTEINDFNSADIDSLYPKAMMIMPMKVWSLPKNKSHMKEEVLNDDKYFKTVKKDGYWYQLEKTMDGECFLFSKTVSKKTGLLSEKGENVPHIIQPLLSKIPNGTVMVGEIYIQGKTSSDITKIMGCLPEKAIERQKLDEDKVSFYVHDLLMYKNTSLLEVGAYDRFKLLTKAFEICGLNDEPFIEIAELITTDGVEALSRLLNEGEEGLILKLKDGAYFPDKRPSWNTIKFKRTTGDLDVVCMGYEAPTKIYAGKEINDWKYFDTDGTSVTKAYKNGWIGALKIGVYIDNVLTQIGTVSSGLTEDLLIKIAADPESFTNKALTVGAMEINEEDKTLRHPFVNSKVGTFGFREDMDIKDCTWEKMLVAKIG